MSTTTETWGHRDIFTNGIRMHYVIQGEGPLVVMLHGFPEFWYSWRHQIPFLAQHGYTAVAPDLRGYNDTDKPRRGYDIPTLLRDIEGLSTREVAAVLNVEEVTVRSHISSARVKLAKYVRRRK